jgi:hypothetical protein
MKRLGKGSVFALVAALALALAGGGITPGSAFQARPAPLTSIPPTPPPLSATATPAPSGTLVRFSGQLADFRGGFVFFTTGDGFRADPALKIHDVSGALTNRTPETGDYARAAFDTGSGNVVELTLSPKPLPNEASYEDIRHFAVALSTPVPNPDDKGGVGLNGKPVLVIFFVEVPPKTPFADAVYVATDISGWQANAIRMDRVDTLHYRIARDFASGTKFLYRYTRGSWRSSERGQDGLEVTPRKFVVGNADVQRITNTVYHWGDENQSAPDLGSSIPTPFNPIPFNTPPHH